MSTFAVTIERIADVWAHTNAERLEMARLASMSYQFVIAKGSFRAGDLVIYFPIDSLLPEAVITTIGLTGKLAGAKQNRVKTIRLRGQISQGIVAEPQLLLPDWNTSTYREGQDITEQLGVIKFEPPPIFSNAGNLVPLPPLVSVYDIEGAERFGSLVERLLDEPVLITEKLEGSHFAASIDETGIIAVSQRRYKIEPIDSVEHDWHRAARLSGLRDKLPALKAEIEQQRGASVATVTVRGELIGPGVQGNYYKLPQQTIRVFEIEVNGEALAVHDFLALVEQFQIEIVPVLAVNVTLRAWLNGRSIVDASNGASVLNPVLAREGIVIRPLTELRDDTIGRLIIKQRSPDYLAISEY